MCNTPQKIPDYPAWHDSVNQAVSADNLKAAASKTTDPHVLLGLACLARAGNPVRKEIAESAVNATPEYAPIVAVLSVIMDGVDETAVGELIRRDPDNALGYYLQGNVFYDGGKENKALEAYRKAAHCSELRFYEATTGEALFKALDALNLKGRERSCVRFIAACSRQPRDK